MNYEESVDYLNEQKNSVIRPGLDTVRALLRLLGDPQKGMRYVHLAGTNGKGSTAAYIESVLRTAGYKTGFFTSPYIERFSEKIRVDNQDMNEDTLVSLTGRVKEAADRLAKEELYPTPFELQTAVAFLYFKAMACDIIVLETGLGGRLDATNIIQEAEVSVLTSISYDHMDYLGGTIEEIAFEKAGIIKPGGRVVSYPQKPEAASVIKKRCLELHADLQELNPVCIENLRSDLTGQSFRFLAEKPYEIHLLGQHQVYNASLALMALHVLKDRGWRLDEKAIRKGLKDARWKGRMEVLLDSPLLLIDGAHNPDGVKSLAASLKTLFPGRKIIFMTGVLKDKDYPTMLKEVIPLARCFYTVTPNSLRALPASKLAEELRQAGCQAESFSSVKEALDRCMALGEDEVICAFGSLYYIGEVRSLVKGIRGEKHVSKNSPL